jgi:hypothetical protein
MPPQARRDCPGWRIKNWWNCIAKKRMLKFRWGPYLGGVRKLIPGLNAALTEVGLEKMHFFIIST